jgi:hypothetical protein
MSTDDERIGYLSGDEDVRPVDDAERADLDELRALLADSAVWADPPAGLEDTVVAAIAAQAGDAASPTAAPHHAPARAPRRRVLRSVALVVAAAAALLVAVVVVAGRDGDSSQLAASLGPTELSPNATGRATFEQTDSGWRIEFHGSGLPRLDNGRFYQAWLRNDAGVLVAIGTFNEPEDVVLWAGVSPRDFSTITVTQELADGDAASSGERVLVGSITER